jgi:hypothetical protein
MHQTRKLLAQFTEERRQHKEDKVWAVAAVTLTISLMIAIAFALYPLS